jgi:hypothetical protein
MLSAFPFHRYSVFLFFWRKNFSRRAALAAATAVLGNTTPRVVGSFYSFLTTIFILHIQAIV